jgi:hypothetical protein
VELHALCLVAFDTLPVIRRGERLSTPEFQVLMAVLDSTPARTRLLTTK